MTKKLKHIPYEMHSAEGLYISEPDLTLVSEEEYNDLSEETFNLNKQLDKYSLLYVISKNNAEIADIIDKVFEEHRHFGAKPGSKEDIPLRSLISWGFTTAGLFEDGYVRVINYGKKGKFRQERMSECITDALKRKGIKPLGVYMVGDKPIGHSL